jgi:hypothetical protein
MGGGDGIPLLDWHFRHAHGPRMEQTGYWKFIGFSRTTYPAITECAFLELLVAQVYG